MTFSLPNDIKKTSLPDYVVVFSDQADPAKESRFRAASDDEATDLMHAQFPDHPWTLFRIAGNERWHVHIHHGRGVEIEAHTRKTNPEPYGAM